MFCGARDVVCLLRNDLLHRMHIGLQSRRCTSDLKGSAGASSSAWPSAPFVAGSVAAAGGAPFAAGVIAANPGAASPGFETCRRKTCSLQDGRKANNLWLQGAGSAGTGASYTCSCVAVSASQHTDTTRLLLLASMMLPQGQSGCRQASCRQEYALRRPITCRRGGRLAGGAPGERRDGGEGGSGRGDSAAGRRRQAPQRRRRCAARASAELDAAASHTDRAAASDCRRQAVAPASGASAHEALVCVRASRTCIMIGISSAAWKLAGQPCLACAIVLQTQAA